MPGSKRVIHVVGALIEEGGRYLVCQRRADDSFGSYWEFPGGKVERGEGKRPALIREIREELGVGIDVGKLVGIFEDEMPQITIRFFLYRCRVTGGTPQPHECQDMRMATINELKDLTLTPVDKKAVGHL